MLARGRAQHAAWRSGVTAPPAQALSQCPIRSVCDAAHAVGAAATLLGLTEAAHRVAPEVYAAVQGVLAAAAAAAAAGGGGGVAGQAQQPVSLPALYGRAGGAFRGAIAAALAAGGGQAAPTALGFDGLGALAAAAGSGAAPDAATAEAVLCSACVPRARLCCRVRVGCCIPARVPYVASAASCFRCFFCCVF